MQSVERLNGRLDHLQLQTGHREGKKYRSRACSWEGGKEAMGKHIRAWADLSNTKLVAS